MFQEGRMGRQYGFVQSNIWFPEEETPLLTDYLSNLIKKIEDYGGENWIDRYPPMKE